VHRLAADPPYRRTPLISSEVKNAPEPVLQ
jgi:hypothetical protein